MSKVFDPFFRSNNADNGRSDGTGLGLYICKRLVAKMGGRMKLASTLNKGTIVSFTLPLENTTGTQCETRRIIHPQQPTAVDVKIRPAYKWKILFAEDNRINRIVGEEYLKKYGCELIFAKNGEEAVEKFKQGQFDMVLMDCQMPEMDGLDATRAIRMFERENGRPAMPIVAVTAHASEQSRLECIEAGMNDYVCKPYTEDALLSVLRKWSATVT